MSKAQTCPVCLGKGKIKADINEFSTNVTGSEICHGCGGKGWVTVPV